MEEKKEKNLPLIIPANCSPMKYVIDGFTGVDLTYVCVDGFISIVISAITFVNNDNPMIALFILMFGIGLGIVIFKRDNYAENMIDKIKILSRYKKSHKKFVYKYINTWEMKDEFIRK